LVDYREYGDDEIIEMIKEFVREEWTILNIFG
jgi:hypothetical protein